MQKNKRIYSVLTGGNLEDAFIGQNSQNIYFILYLCHKFIENHFMS